MLGCISISGSQDELLQFEEVVRDILKSQKNIPTFIDIKDNPNNSKPPKKITVKE